MKAHVGDHLVVRSTHVDEPARDGRVVEIHGPDGEPPFVVRWSVDGHSSLFFPGPDTVVVPVRHRPPDVAARREA